MSAMPNILREFSVRFRLITNGQTGPLRTKYFPTARAVLGFLDGLDASDGSAHTSVSIAVREVGDWDVLRDRKALEQVVAEEEAGR